MIRVGTDIVSIDRISKSIERFGDRFLSRFLSQKELGTLSLKTSSVAGYWAVKEALSKALGCGIGAELSFHDITVRKDTKGAPFIILEDKIMEEFAVKYISVSISHDGGFAIAVVALEMEK